MIVSSFCIYCLSLERLYSSVGGDSISIYFSFEYTPFVYNFIKDSVSGVPVGHSDVHLRKRARKDRFLMMVRPLNKDILGR
jgi:hypothetical protein